MSEENPPRAWHEDESEQLELTLEEVPGAERVPTVHMERSYLYLGADTTAIHLNGPVNENVMVGDTILVFAADQREQWQVVVDSIDPATYSVEATRAG